MIVVRVLVTEFPPSVWWELFLARKNLVHSASSSWLDPLGLLDGADKHPLNGGQIVWNKAYLLVGQHVNLCASAVKCEF